MKRIARYFGSFVAGFMGGVLSHWFIGWLMSTPCKVSPTPADVVATANTFIIFTTIIFTGVTVIVAIVGMAIAQRFAQSKELHERLIVDDLILKAKNDESLGRDIIKGIVENTEVTKYLDDVFLAKIHELVDSQYDGQFASISSQIKEDGE